MLTAEGLQRNVAAYREGSMSLEQFENWFEEASSDVYGISELRDLCFDIDAALAGYHYDHIGEDALRQELAKALRPVANVWSEAEGIEVSKGASLRYRASSAMKPQGASLQSA